MQKQNIILFNSEDNLKLFYTCNNLLMYMIFFSIFYYMINRNTYILDIIIKCQLLGIFFNICCLCPKIIFISFLSLGTYEFFFHWKNSLSIINLIILWNFIYLFPFILMINFNNDVKIMKVIIGISMIDIWSMIAGKTKILSWKIKAISDISPNKTIIGYITGSIVGKIIFSYLDIHFSNIIILCAILGDLFCSFLKRNYGVNEGFKDFGWLLGSHGGILDRIDSHLLGVTSYCILNYFY